MNTASIREMLEDYVSQGGFSIGQIQVSGELELCHLSDVNLGGLERYSSSQSARQLAIYDDAGKYRPLKSAPNLRRGWKLSLSSLAEVHLALDAFYPAALGSWLAFLRGRLAVTSLRATLGRQTGMYRVAGLLTDEQAGGLIESSCSSQSCMRRVLWPIELGKAHLLMEPMEALTYEPTEIPILCGEACNLLVAEGRKVVKAAQAK